MQPKTSIYAARPLRIAVLGSTYPRSQDDYEVPWLRESVNRIAARGHEVSVIAPSFAGLRHHTIDGIPVRRFRYAPAAWEKLTHGSGAPNKIRANPFLKLLTLTYILSGIWSTWRLCWEKKIDILHVHWPFPHGLMALLPAAINGVKVVSSCHSAELALASQSKFSTRILSICLRRSSGVTANSRHTAELAHKLTGVGPAVIPYGATVEVNKAITHLPPSPEEIPLLLFSGRLIARKGVDFLLRAMPLILAKRKVRLVITGDGQYRVPWQALSLSLGINEQVEFAGFVSHERLSQLFRSCSMYVHPAIYDERGDTEGLGVVLIEALYNKKPVVASRVGGIPDVIQNERTGLLVPEKDSQALASAVLRLLEDSPLAARLGEAGFSHAARYFDWEDITDRLEALYRRVLTVDEPAGGPESVKKSLALK